MEGKDPTVRTLECFNKIDGTYRQLCFPADGTKLIGGLLAGDGKDYSKLLQLSKKDDLGGKTPESWAFGKPGPGEGSGMDDGGNGTGLTDDDVICSCLNVTKATVKKAIEYEKPLPFQPSQTARKRAPAVADVVHQLGKWLRLWQPH